jgi:hypothetical protein
MNGSGAACACHDIWVLFVLDADTEYDRPIGTRCVPFG